MKTDICIGAGCKAALLLFLLLLSACGKRSELDLKGGSPVSVDNVARMFAQLPICREQLEEVHGAVSSSLGNGYDEEYLLRDLLVTPGKGVGDDEEMTRTRAGSTPLKELVETWYKEKYPSTRSADGNSAEKYLTELKNSDMQIYWPYSEDWDGKSKPIITFDPGFVTDRNSGFELGEDGELKEVIVTEELAMRCPVWVINRNDDSSYKTLEMFRKDKGFEAVPSDKSEAKTLYIKDFTMNQHYDCWLAGASEFFIKCGSIEDFTASTEAELRLYSPAITDFMVVVKRKQLGQKIPLNTILVSQLTEQVESLAFMITEDDGGTRTNWKCSATVKIKSRSYGFEIELPLNTRDDIVWRGSLSPSFFSERGVTEGKFGGVSIGFELY